MVEYINKAEVIDTAMSMCNDCPDGSSGWCGQCYLLDAVKKIEQIPVADVVHVIRCRECKHYRVGDYFEDVKFCYRLRDIDSEPIPYVFSDNDFCSYGERKDA